MHRPAGSSRSPWEHKVQLVHKGLLEPKGQPEQMGIMELREIRVKKEKWETQATPAQ